MTEQERNDRNARYAAAYNYPLTKKPDCTVAMQKEFGNLYADEYAADGLTLAEAWKVYEADQANA